MRTCGFVCGKTGHPGPGKHSIQLHPYTLPVEQRRRAREREEVIYLQREKAELGDMPKDRKGQGALSKFTTESLSPKLLYTSTSFLQFCP